MSEDRSAAEARSDQGTMRVRVASLVIVLAAVAVACTGGDGGTSARLVVDGTASVSSADGGARQVDDSRTLRAGDRVKVDSGSAVIRLYDGRELELRDGTEVELGAAGATGSGLQPSLLAGDLLVTASGGSGGKVSVTAADTEVAVGDGSARLARGSAVSVASYTAGVTVSSTGRSLDVPPLRQVSVPAAGLLPGRPSPLIYKSGDSWDQRFLGDAIDLGTQLVSRSRGFTAQLAPNKGRTPGFYRQIIPALENEPLFDEASIDPQRPPGESLVGLAITVQGTRQSFTDRLRAVFAFHDEGAAWGLVALDQGVLRAPLLAGVDEAIGRGPLSAAEAPPPSAAAPATSTPGATQTAPSGDGDSETAAPAPETPSAPAAPTPPPPLVGVPLVDDTVNSLVDVLSGLLGGLGRRP